MKILIIEDDMNKLKQLVDFIAEIRNESQITEKYSYQSGLREIYSYSHELIILDMSLPSFDKTPTETGGRPRKFAGRELLRQMKRKNINIPVIIVTQFDKFGEGEDTITLPQLVDELKNEYASIFFGLVYYNTAYKNWRDEFGLLLSKGSLVQLNKGG
ncbi:hypothetical protein OMP38_23200 [Cohnella ginsengisoli]|uniref:Response regulator n=1 Tax=Cohnella ginsengisoli TaxID=425004 RepID=A0A9X4KK76_9BACL|nr:hypothetical protein [Cohnella ginsengisoli]MDG0793420.1 hypothetical protein [Cohnella ginsengisoli]